MKLVAIIPTKKSSERFPGKNTADIYGTPMIEHTFQAVYSLKEKFHKIVVITDDNEVSKLTKEWKFELTNATPTVFKGRVKEACQYVIQGVGKDYTHFCLLLPTNPLRTSEDILFGLDLFKTIPEPDYVMSVTEYPFNAHYALKETFDNQTGIFHYRRGLMPLIEKDIDVGREHFGPTYFVDGAVYWASIDAFIKNKWSISPICPNTLFFRIPKERSWEVDSEFDLKVIRMLMKERE